MRLRQWSYRFLDVQVDFEVFQLTNTVEKLRILFLQRVYRDDRLFVSAV